ncbi:MAG: hypothetical protein JOY92_14405 [Verrucomicrobia bacterium]|nr:hypothetical protein [Verrucomicrobiota bacterium]
MQNTPRALRVPGRRKGPRRALHQIRIRGQNLRIYREADGATAVESRNRQEPGAFETAVLLDYLRAEGYVPEKTSFRAGFSETSPTFALRRAVERFRRSDNLQAACAMAVATLGCLLAAEVFRLLAVVIR